MNPCIFWMLRVRGGETVLRGQGQEARVESRLQGFSGGVLTRGKASSPSPGCGCAQQVTQVQGWGPGRGPPQAEGAASTKGQSQRGACLGSDGWRGMLASYRLPDTNDCSVQEGRGVQKCPLACPVPEDTPFDVELWWSTQRLWPHTAALCRFTPVSRNIEILGFVARIDSLSTCCVQTPLSLLGTRVVHRARSWAPRRP